MTYEINDKNDIWIVWQEIQYFLLRNYKSKKIEVVSISVTKNKFNKFDAKVEYVEQKV